MKSWLKIYLIKEVSPDSILIVSQMTQEFISPFVSVISNIQYAAQPLYCRMILEKDHRESYILVEIMSVGICFQLEVGGRTDFKNRIS